MLMNLYLETVTHKFDETAGFKQHKGVFLSHQKGRIFVSTFGDEISTFHHLTSKIFFPTKTLISPKQIIGGHNI